jgi:hypothetical protein
MASKTLNKRKKSRGLKNRTKKYMRKDLGRGKIYDDNSTEKLFNAHRELSSLRGPDAALGHLKKLQTSYPTDIDLKNLIDDLEDSDYLLKQSERNLARLISSNADSNSSS